MKTSPLQFRVLLISVVASFGHLTPCVAASQRDVAISGREATAVHLAVADFLRHRYSKSGDLTRYTVQVARTRGQLEVTFVPDTDSRGPYPGGGTDYGPEVTYYMALRPPKILYHLFGQ